MQSSGSDLIILLESCTVLSIHQMLAQKADAKTRVIYWNSINAPSVTFCSRIIAPQNLSVGVSEVMESQVVYVYLTDADAFVHFHPSRRCSSEKQL